MQTTTLSPDARRYAKCIEVSKRIRWDIDRDVIRGRTFDFSKKFLPDGPSLVDQLVSGVQDPRFAAILSGMITGNQSNRIGAALAPIMH